MSEDEKANWQKIKDVMEEKGTTDNMFYKRACATVSYTHLTLPTSNGV